MQDLNDKITGGSLTAAEWNEVPSELQNVIEALGQVLSTGDLNQLGKSIAGYVANGDAYTDSGVANAYVLSVIGSKQGPTAYTDVSRIRFVAGASNTGASTANVATLGVKTFKREDGSGLSANDIRIGELVTADYDIASGFLILVRNVQSASTTREGISELATSAETIAGTDAERAVTPAGLEAKVSSTTEKGISELATDAEAIAGVDTERVVTPSGLGAAVPSASTTGKGKVELATSAETIAGTDTERAVTPAGLEAKVASTTEKGIAELATNAETQAGADAGRVVTPAGLESKTATETRKGIAEVATQAETDAGTDDDRMITALKLANYPPLTFRGALVYRSSTKSIVTGTETTIDWDAEEYDTSTMHDNATNNTRLTVPSGVTKVKLTAMILWGSNSSSYRRLRMKKNGAIATLPGIGAQNYAAATPASTNQAHSWVTAPIIVVGGDYFEIAVTQGTGANLDVLGGSGWSWFAMEVVA